MHEKSKAHAKGKGANAPKNQEHVPPADAKVILPGRGTKDKLSLAFVAASFLLGALYYFNFPDRITAYIESGEAGMAPKLFGLFAVPVAGVFLYLAVTYIPPILLAHGKKIPAKTLEYAKPAMLAYFLYTEISIISFNSANISFSGGQDTAAALAIGLASIGAAIMSSKSMILPKLQKGASDDVIAGYNLRIGNFLAAWSAIVFLGFFAETYLPVAIIVPAAIIAPYAVYLAKKAGKSAEIENLKKQVESPPAAKNEH